MTKVSCYTHSGLTDKVATALMTYAPMTEIVEIERYDPFMYGREVAARWKGEENIVIIEHDVVIDDTFQAFLDCRAPWCSYSYQIWDIEFPYGIGCTKFTPIAQRCVPWPEHVHWHDLDWFIGSSLYGYGITPHIHGSLEHLHEYAAATPEVYARSQEQIRQLIISTRAGVFKNDLTMWHASDPFPDDAEVTYRDPVTGRMIPFNPETITVYRDSDTGKEWAEVKKQHGDG